MHARVWPERVMAQRRSWRCPFCCSCFYSAQWVKLGDQKSDFRRLGQINIYNFDVTLIAVVVEKEGDGFFLSFRFRGKGRAEEGGRVGG